MVLPRDVGRVLREVEKKDNSLAAVEEAVTLLSTKSQQELQTCLTTALQSYKERKKAPTTVKEDEPVGLTMYLDCRGEAGYRDRILMTDVREHVKVTKLQRGDCMIMVGKKALWTAERKTIGDLTSSLSDGRLYRQTLARKKMGETEFGHPYTLLLEDCQSAIINRPDLLQLLMRRLPKGISLIHASTPDDTARIYSAVYNHLAQNLSVGDTASMQEVSPSPPSDWEAFIRAALGHRDATHADAFLREFPTCAALRERGPAYARLRMEALGLERDFASQVSELAHPL